MSQKHIFPWSIFFCFLLFLIITYTMSRAFFPWNIRETSVDFPPYSLPCVILDAGHGGMDGGASSEDQTLEKDLNLEIVLILRDLLENAGIKTILTRETDIMLSLDEQKGTRKMQDLRARLNIAESHPDAIFVSIHMNHFSQSKYKGLQVYYSPNHRHSEVLAQQIQSTVKTYLQPENQRECKEATSAIFLMHRMKNVGVLVECGFLSNPEDTNALKEKENQQKLAFVLSNAIMESCYVQ